LIIILWIILKNYGSHGPFIDDNNYVLSFKTGDLPYNYAEPEVIFGNVMQPMP
jgi:hypothetical protein